MNQIGKINDHLKQSLSFNEIESRKKASGNIEKLQNYNEAYYNLRHKEATKYEEGDFIMIPNIDVTPSVNKKVIPKHKEPYVIKKNLTNR